ncbi:hypothetical protein [Candidatus Avelusimicrobium luingense]|uniref:hypothetical protein n=1 Tax=Candidatus Avelusimicrobium luingense TaxID=3416211 RepID=UPI003D140A61
MKNFGYHFWLAVLVIGALYVGVPMPSFAQGPVVKGACKVAEVSSCITRAVQPKVPSVAAWQSFSGEIDKIISSSISVPDALPAAPSRAKVGRQAWYIEKWTKVSHYSALRRAVEKLGTQPPNPWPKTQEGELVVPTLDGLTLDGYHGVLPQFPFPNRTIYLVRGMGLTQEELRNVLREGLRVSDVKHDYSTDFNARVTSAGTMPFTSELLQNCSNHCIYLATDTERGLNFAYINAFKEGKIPVVVVVNSRWKTHEGDHVIAQDIPAEDFVAIAVLIRGPFGDPVWCKVSLATDGESFRFIPYQ